MHFNVEQECNSFLKKKVYAWQSTYQSTAIPIPVFPPIDSSVNFIGRLARALLNYTDFQKTIYLDQMSAWYDERGVYVSSTISPVIDSRPCSFAPSTHSRIVRGSMTRSALQ